MVYAENVRDPIVASHIEVFDASASSAVKIHVNVFQHGLSVEFLLFHLVSLVR